MSERDETQKWAYFMVGLLLGSLTICIYVIWGIAPAMRTVCKGLIK